MTHQHILRKLLRQPILTEDSIRTAFQKTSENTTVMKKHIGNVDGFEIATSAMRYYISKHPINELNKKKWRLTDLQESLLGLCLPIPIHLSNGKLYKNSHRILKSTNPLAEANKWLTDEISTEVLVAYYRKYLAISDSFSEYKDIIFETIEAYHAGYAHIATMSLFPVLEGGLRNLQEKKLGFDSDNVKSDVFCAGIKKSLLKWGKESLSGFDWWPGKDETSTLELDFFTHANLQCDAINTFLIFFKDALYKPSKSNNFTNGFNRHLILHLLKMTLKSQQIS